MADADLREETTIVAGLDLGQQADWSALAILKRSRLVPPEGPRIEEQTSAATGKTVTVYDHRERPGQPRHKSRYKLDFLCRWDLGTPYPVINDKIVALYSKPPLAGTRLAVDYTGAGMPVVDWLRRSKPRCVLWPVLITAGSKATHDAATGAWHVAKKELVSCLQVVLQGRRLDIVKGLQHAGTLVKEFESFRVKVTASANETFEAWRERDHDDLVLACALAVWVGEKGGVEFVLR